MALGCTGSRAQKLDRGPIPSPQLPSPPPQPPPRRPSQSYKTALVFAAEHGNLAAVKALLGKHANHAAGQGVSSAREGSQHARCAGSCLFKAAPSLGLAEEFPTPAPSLVPPPPAPEDLQVGPTAFILAVLNEHLEVANALLKAGVSVDQVGKVRRRRGGTDESWGGSSRPAEMALRASRFAQQACCTGVVGLMPKRRAALRR